MSSWYLQYVELSNIWLQYKHAHEILKKMSIPPSIIFTHLSFQDCRQLEPVPPHIRQKANKDGHISERWGNILPSSLISSWIFQNTMHNKTKKEDMIQIRRSLLLREILVINNNSNLKLSVWINILSCEKKEKLYINYNWMVSVLAT